MTGVNCTARLCSSEYFEPGTGLVGSLISWLRCGEVIGREGEMLLCAIEENGRGGVAVPVVAAGEAKSYSCVMHDSRSTS